MKRVLHVMGSLQRSGMEMMLLSSYAEWRLLGYECDVLATKNTVGPLAQRMEECGYGVFHIPFRSRLRYLPRARFILEFYQLCRSGYDVVHIHTEAAPPIFATLAKLAGVRRVAVTPHNTFRFSGALRMRKRIERRFVRLLGGRYGMISEGVRLCEWETFRNQGVRTWNWFDTAHFRPAEEQDILSIRHSLGIREGEFVIASVGNCNRAKNHAALLGAIKLLPSTLSPLYLHIGSEESGFPERTLAQELRIETKVRYLGAQEDPLQFLWAADVFVMPSLNEGLSIAAIEAVAAGAPALFSNVPGLAEVAGETRHTILSEASPDSIAEALLRMVSIEPSERRRRALADSELIREKFSIENGVRSICDGLYADI